MLAAVDAAMLRAQRSGRPHRLVVAARQGTGSGLLADVVRAYRRQPGAADVEVVFTRDQIDLVRNGSADIALACDHGVLDGMEFSELVKVETFALLPLDHSLAAKPAVSVADIVQDELFRPLSSAVAPEAMLDEIVDKVAMGELITMVGASATDRIGSAVTAVPVVDAPPTLLVLTWRQDVPAATRDAFVHTAQRVAAGTRASQPQGPSWVAPPRQPARSP